jgi:signal transduction histidine kinase
MQREGAASVEHGRAVSRDLLNRLIIFAVLAAFIAIVYSAVVVGIGAAFDASMPNTGLSVVATSVVALAFGRVRRRAQRLANRITYGERSMPEEVLAHFSEQVAASYAPEEALPRIARAIAEGTGAARAEVWVRVEEAFLFGAEWPATDRGRRARVPFGGPSLPAFSDVDRVVAVRHQDELLGAITIAKRAGEPVTGSEEKLLDDVASQAGLVMRNVALTADLAARLEEIEGAATELRASRQRIVEAQDSERRRIERDIHDGAQQHLVALAVKLRMARTATEKDAAKAAQALADVRTLIDQALDNLRDLARGIYPPVLAEQGLAAALRGQALPAGLKATLTSRCDERFDAAVEAAVYFCCLEAIQNAAKHGATRVKIHLRLDDGVLSFSVADDGPGFDAATATRGSGLQNMEDRVAAVGGRVEIRSEPGGGTTMTGSVVVRSKEKLA